MRTLTVGFVLATIWSVPLLTAQTESPRVKPSELFADLESRLKASVDERRSGGEPRGSARPDEQSLPAVPEAGVVMVNDSNTSWDASRLSLITRVRFLKPSSPPKEITTPATTSNPVINDPTQQVMDWIRKGTASGWSELLYDNRDRDHSNLDVTQYPGLTRVEYSPEAHAAEADWGMRNLQAFDQPTFGNSSTALVGSPFWRSNPRMVMHDDLQMQIAEQHFLHNQLYCYPEHNDFDAQHGDVYPINAPYWVISQGSSGSDQPFLRAIALSLGAMSSDVRRALEKSGQLMAAVQVLLRRSQKSVKSDEDYFTAAAHPVVFRSEELDVDRMVALAHGLTLESLPIVTRVRVVREDLGRVGRDYFHPTAAEQLVDTETVVARVFRSTAQTRTMVVDASATRDELRRRLSFRWEVLQGDSQHVRVEPLNESRSRVKLTIKWHPTSTIPSRPELKTNRVDIGVFAMNGVSLPLPAIVCSFTLANEAREYDASGRIQSVTYQTPEDGGAYVDPAIDSPKSWRDVYQYDDAGKLNGWTRTHRDKSVQTFDAAGRLNPGSADGVPQVVGYEAQKQPDETFRLQQVAGP